MTPAQSPPSVDLHPVGRGASDVGASTHVDEVALVDGEGAHRVSVLQRRRALSRLSLFAFLCSRWGSCDLGESGRHALPLGLERRRFCNSGVVDDSSERLSDLKLVLDDAMPDPAAAQRARDRHRRGEREAHC